MRTGHAGTITASDLPRPPMEHMVRSLAPQQQEVLVATYFRGRTTREAARVLGLTPTTVETRLHQAMRDLSRMVAAYRG